jgi:hypothetical protein
VSATISDCGHYRYDLTRVINPNPVGVVMFIGVNPSTADATLDDQTVRKWAGFTQRWGYGVFRVGNLFAYRATDVRELSRVPDPVGPDNDRHLHGMLAQASLVVPCWGNASKIPLLHRSRIKKVCAMLRDLDVFTPVQCLGKTKSGDPKHPLMLGYNTPLTEWTTEAAR